MSTGEPPVDSEISVSREGSDAAQSLHLEATTDGHDAWNDTRLALVWADGPGACRARVRTRPYIRLDLERVREIATRTNKLHYVTHIPLPGHAGDGWPSGDWGR